MSLPIAVRLTPKEIEFCELFAEEHGLAALLDHLGLGGLGNQVVALIRTEQAAQEFVEFNRPDPDFQVLAYSHELVEALGGEA